MLPFQSYNYVSIYIIKLQIIKKVEQKSAVNTSLHINKRWTIVIKIKEDISLSIANEQWRILITLNIIITRRDVITLYFPFANSRLANFYAHFSWIAIRQAKWRQNRPRKITYNNHWYKADDTLVLHRHVGRQCGQCRWGAECAQVCDGCPEEKKHECVQFFVPNFVVPLIVRPSLDGWNIVKRMILHLTNLPEQ